MLVYTAGFAMSWGPVCWVLLAEIFPNMIRSTVMSIAVAGQWIANFLVSWTFPMLDKNQYLTDTFNHGMAYWFMVSWEFWLPYLSGNSFPKQR